MKHGKLILTCALIGIPVLTWARAIGPLRSPQDAFADFAAATLRAEDQLTDPLVLAGPRVRPLVLESLKDRSFSLRRYAIAYLGCAGYRPALPRLRLLLDDETEADYLRADALEAIGAMDLSEGLLLARTYEARADFLGEAASSLRGGSWTPRCRSWADAFLGVHE